MHAEKEDQAEDQEGHCWLLGRPVPVARMFRRAPCSRGSSRLAEESLISSSWISSHWASVRWLSGIARSSCKRARGDIGCGACMAILSHRSAGAAPPGAKPPGIYLCRLDRFAMTTRALDGLTDG